MKSEEQCCGTCHWASRDRLGDYICVNGDSDHCADYVGYKGTCEEWEEKE